jgi:exonuclease SbcC
MKIKSIELKNFLVHEDSVVDFVDGINIITGQNGSGKSSIVEAICYSLFGKAIYQGSGEHLIRHGKRDFLIKMVMSNNQRDVIIERRYKGFTTNLYGIDGSESFQRYLLKNFNINYKRYVSTLLIRQKSIDEFIRKSPKGRMEEFERIIGIDILKKIIDVNKRIIRDCEIYIKGFDYFKKKNDLEEIEKAIDNILKENEEKIKNKENLEKTLNELKERKKLLESAKELYKKLKDIENYEKEYIEIEKELEKDKEVFERYEKYKEIYKKAIEVKSAYENLIKVNKELENIEKHKEGYEKYQEYLNYLNDDKIKEIESIVKRGKEIKEKLENEFGEVNGEIINQFKQKEKELLERKQKIILRMGEIENEISQNQKILKELENVLVNCPICKRPLDENHKKMLIQEAKTSINKLLLEKQRLKQESENIEKELSEVKRKLKFEPIFEEYIKLKEIFDKNRQNWEKLVKVKNYKIYEEDYKIYSQKFAFEKRKSEYENKIKEWNYNFNFQEVIDFVEENRKFYENYLSKLSFKNQLEKEISKKKEILLELENYKDTDFENIDAQIENIEKEIERISNEIGKLEGEIKANERMINEFKIRKEDIKKELNEYERKKSQKEIYEDLNNRLLNLITLERKRSYENLKFFVQHYFNKFNLSDYKSIGIEFLDESMEIFLKNESGYDINVNSLSGGEKTALSLAIRLAIAQMLDIKFKIFILDEPTDGMDDERIESLGELFYNFIKYNQDYQLIIITHEEEIAQMGYYRIHLERKNNRSYISYV